MYKYTKISNANISTLTKKKFTAKCYTATFWRDLKDGNSIVYVAYIWSIGKVRKNEILSIVSRN